MRRAAITICFLLGFAFSSAGQDVSAKNEPRAAEKSENASPKPGDKVLGIDQSLRSREPVTTEIEADEAFFDSTKYIGTFTGHVKVTDPRFSLQSDKLTIYMRKGQNEGLEKAVAEGNVGVVRDRPAPNGAPPTRSVGRCETAIYMGGTGDMELRGTPRVQQGINTHVATSPDTVMIINQNGQLTTHGPSRTDIRQEPTAEKKAEASPTP